MEFIHQIAELGDNHESMVAYDDDQEEEEELRRQLGDNFIDDEMIFRINTHKSIDFHINRGSEDDSRACCVF